MSRSAVSFVAKVESYGTLTWGYGLSGSGNPDGRSAALPLLADGWVVEYTRTRVGGSKPCTGTRDGVDVITGEESRDTASPRCNPTCSTPCEGSTKGPGGGVAHGRHYYSSTSEEKRDHDLPFKSLRRD